MQNTRKSVTMSEVSALQMGSQISNKIKECEKAITAANSDLGQCAAMISQLKIDLTTLPGLMPGAELTQAALQDIECAQVVYELATLLSVKQEDVIGFERHVSRVKTYYVDYSTVIATSKRKNLILALNLLRLVAQNRIPEFHCELELIPAPDRVSDNNIAYVLELEQYLMEGSYSRVTEAAGKIPDPAFEWFVTLLLGTVREKIAASAEKAYDRLDLDAATKLLSLKSKNDLALFCVNRGWKVIGTDIIFSRNAEIAAANSQVPSVELIKRSLDYARELEQII